LVYGETEEHFRTDNHDIEMLQRYLFFKLILIWHCQITYKKIKERGYTSPCLLITCVFQFHSHSSMKPNIRLNNIAPEWFPIWPSCWRYGNPWKNCSHPSYLAFAFQQFQYFTWQNYAFFCSVFYWQLFFIFFSSLNLKTKNPFRYLKGRKKSIRVTTLIPV